MQHVNYPHEPGRLHDCPACEARCHCTEPNETQCVFEGTHTLIVERELGRFFIGDLVAGKRLANQNRHITLNVREAPPEGTPVYVVEFFDDEARTMLAEFGASVTDYEEAWRYALGSFFGAEDWDTEQDDTANLHRDLESVAGAFM